MKTEKIRIKLLNETIYRSVLPSGLTAIVIPRPGFTKKIGILAANYGSLDIEFRENGKMVKTPAGVAHFLEHQLFKKHGGDSLMEFSRWGANSNAFTDNTMTAYYFTCSEHYDDCLAELFKLVFKPEFEKSRVEKEKSIIAQEILMYEDMAEVRGARNLLQQLYQKHPVRIDIAGTVETIHGITPDTLYRCYRHFYNPSNVLLVMAGDLDVDGTLRKANDLMKGVELKSKEVSHDYEPDPPEVAGRDARCEMVVSRPRVMLGFKDVVGRDSPKECLKRDVETSILLDLLFGRSGEYFSREYLAGVIDDEFGASYTTNETYGYTVVAAETEKIEAFKTGVLQEIERAKRRRFKAQDVERMRRKIAGRFIRSFDSPDSAAFVSLEMEHRRTTLEETLAMIHEVQPRDLQRRLAEHFDPGRMVVSLVLPKKEPPKS